MREAGAGAGGGIPFQVQNARAIQAEAWPQDGARVFQAIELQTANARLKVAYSVGTQMKGGEGAT